MTTNSVSAAAERARLRALARYQLDTRPEPGIDGLARLAALACQTPIALVSLVEAERQWSKAHVGLEENSIPREASFCTHGLYQAGPFVVEDARLDERFRDNPLVTGSAGIRFYAGVPLLSPESLPVGMLCVLDRRPRELSPVQLQMLTLLASQVTAQLELRVSRVEATCALEDSRRIQQRLRTILDHAPIGIWLLGTDERLQFVNATFCRAVGISEQTFLEAPHYATLYPPEVARSCMASDAEAYRSEGPHQSREVLPLSDGQLHHLDITKVRLVDPSGRPEGLVGLSIDVTERLRAEDVRRLAHQETEAASRLKSQFVATMSHEMRTPLNAIVGLSSPHLLSAAPLVLRRYLEEIHCAAQLLAGVVDDVLDFSKIEAGEVHLEQVAFRPVTLMTDVGRLFEHEASAKGVVLDCTCGARVPGALEGDPFRLRQVCTNLLGNALKFTSAGSCRLSLDYEPGEGDTGTLLLICQDTGIGMAPEAQKRLFSPFMQAEASISRRFGGTGLGLTISRSLVTLMNGTISVESEVDVGTRFTVKVPCRRTAAVPAAEAPTALADLNGMRVLVVDDNPINQLLAGALLRKARAEVTTAHDGREALEVIRAQPPFDAVLMDVQMPVMDGLEATREIRNTLGLRDLPIIALTAHALSEDRARCLKAGMSDHLSKPLHAERFVSMLHKWWRRPAS